MFKKYLALALAMLLLGTTAALAEKPTSQFGFHGWPNYSGGAAVPTRPPVSPTKAPEMGPSRPESATPTASPATQAPEIPTKAPGSSTPARPEATATPRPATGPSMTDDYTTQSAGAQEQIALNLLNQDRARYGIAPLTLDPSLSAIARVKSCDMRDNRYFAHESPTYGRVRDMLTAFGYPYNSAGENIAHHATVLKAEAAFLSSPAHRTVMMNSAWKKVGIGICFDQNGFIYLTEMFVR